jgi:opacity protein-like surface antigen
MNKFSHKTVLILTSCVLSFSGFATPINNDNPFYLGLAAGYGSTNWSGMKALDTPSQDSTPTVVHDSGFEWGAFFGWQPIQNLALEFRYQKFSDSVLTLDKSRYPSPPLPSNSKLTSQTWAYSVVAKLILPIGKSGLAVFGDLGPVYTRRHDPLASSAEDPNDARKPGGKNSNLGIMFGGGLNYDLSDHIRTTLEFSYGSGSGESMQYPVYTYIPFIYSIEFKLAYRFSLAKLFQHDTI